MVGAQLRDYGDRMYVNFTSNTNVFKKSNFVVNEQVVKEFFATPLVSLSEAIGSPPSPPRRCISVQAVVAEDGGLKGGNTPSIRREIVVSNELGEQKLPVKI